MCLVEVDLQSCDSFLLTRNVWSTFYGLQLISAFYSAFICYYFHIDTLLTDVYSRKKPRVVCCLFVQLELIRHLIVCSFSLTSQHRFPYDDILKTIKRLNFLLFSCVLMFQLCKNVWCKLEKTRVTIGEAHFSTSWHAFPFFQECNWSFFIDELLCVCVFLSGFNFWYFVILSLCNFFLRLTIKCESCFFAILLIA